MTWYAKRTGAYYMGSTEADSNAQEALNMLMNNYGWTKAACCGMFGNIDFEGQWNPWRWENDNVLSYNAALTTSYGMGLIGWTPARKYFLNNATLNGVVLFPNYDQEHYPGYGPNFSDRQGLATDGAAQIKLIGEAMARSSGNMWVQRKSCSAHQFMQLTDPEEALYYWLWNAEYPANIQQEEIRRSGHGQAWYNHLAGPSRFPLILLLKKGNDHNNGLL